MELTAEIITVLSTSAVALATLIVSGGTQLASIISEKNRRKKEYYAATQLDIYNRFISAYSNLHMVKDVSEQREFLSALYSAIAIAPPKLRSELETLLSMHTVSSIKPTDENRECFLRCLSLINDHNSKHI